MGSFPFKYQINEEKLGEQETTTRIQANTELQFVSYSSASEELLTSLTLSCIHYKALYLGPFRGDPQLSICVFLEFFQSVSLKGLRTSRPQSHSAK